jgi:hypothetical protein
MNADPKLCTINIYLHCMYCSTQIIQYMICTAIDMMENFNSPPTCRLKSILLARTISPGRIPGEDVEKPAISRLSYLLPGLGARRGVRIVGDGGWDTAAKYRRTLQVP